MILHYRADSLSQKCVKVNKNILPTHFDLFEKIECTKKWWIAVNFVDVAAVSDGLVAFFLSRYRHSTFESQRRGITAD